MVALSSGEAEFYGIVRAVETSKQTSQILEQTGTQLEVTIASDSSPARGICTWTGSGKVRHLAIKELWIQEAYRMKEFHLVSVDTLLNWADIGTKAHTSEILILVAEAGATTLGTGASETGVGMLLQIENSVQSTEMMEKIALHGLIQKVVMNALMERS